MNSSLTKLSSCLSLGLPLCKFRLITVYTQMPHHTISRMMSSHASQSPFYSSMIGIILKSEKPMDEKETLLTALQETQIQIQQKEFQIQIERKEHQIQIDKKDIEFRDVTIKNITEKLEAVNVDKLHLQQLLTVRSIIEKHENNFGEKLSKKNATRLDKWEEYLSSSDGRFKPFQDSGFNLKQVCNEIDVIYKSHSSYIHSIKVMNKFVLETRGLLTETQLKIVDLLIHDSPWKDLISISNLK